jgi:hypothetical protein
MIEGVRDTCSFELFSTTSRCGSFSIMIVYNHLKILRSITMKKLTTFKIRTLAVVLMTLSLTIIIGCATGQVKQKNDISSGDTIVVGNYGLKVPDGYAGITSSEAPPAMKEMAKKLKKYPSEGIYNKNVGTVILFAYFDKIDLDAESLMIVKLENIIDRGQLQGELRKNLGKDFEKAKVESAAYSTTDENFIASATISIEFAAMSFQFCLKRIPYPSSKIGRIVAFAISRPNLINDAKLDMLNILNSAQEV